MSYTVIKVLINNVNLAVNLRKAAFCTLNPNRERVTPEKICLLPLLW